MKYLFLLSPPPSNFVRVIETHITFYALSEKAKNKISFKILNTTREPIPKVWGYSRPQTFLIKSYNTNIGPNE